MKRLIWIGTIFSWCSLTCAIEYHRVKVYAHSENEQYLAFELPEELPSLDFAPDGLELDDIAAPLVYIITVIEKTEPVEIVYAVPSVTGQVEDLRPVLEMGEESLLKRRRFWFLAKAKRGKRLELYDLLLQEFRRSHNRQHGAHSAEWKFLKVLNEVKISSSIDDTEAVMRMAATLISLRTAVLQVGLSAHNDFLNQMGEFLRRGDKSLLPLIRTRYILQDGEQAILSWLRRADALFNPWGCVGAIRSEGTR